MRFNWLSAFYFIDGVFLNDFDTPWFDLDLPLITLAGPFLSFGMSLPGLVGLFCLPLLLAGVDSPELWLRDPLLLFWTVVCILLMAMPALSFPFSAVLLNLAGLSLLSSFVSLIYGLISVCCFFALSRLDFGEVTLILVAVLDDLASLLDAMSSKLSLMVWFYSDTFGNLRPSGFGISTLYLSLFCIMALLFNKLFYRLFFISIPLIVYCFLGILIMTYGSGIFTVVCSMSSSVYLLLWTFNS